MRRLNPDCTPLGASVSFVSSAKAVIGDERSIMHFGLFPVIRCAPPEGRLVVECREKDRSYGSFRVSAESLTLLI